MPLAGAQFVMFGGWRGDLRADAKLHTFGFEQEYIEQVEVANPGAVAAVGIGPGTDRQRDAQQLWYADKVIGRHGQGASQQGVIGVDIAVVDLWRVIVLKIDSRSQAQRVVAFVGGLGVIGQCVSSRAQNK